LVIGIIDYGMGNLRSVEKAISEISHNIQIITDYSQITSVDKLILPGVGAFAKAMQNLTDKGMIAPIKEHISCGKPFLGICLGFQLLFDSSEEFGNTTGLSIIPGEVLKFDVKNVKIPHMGWNTVDVRLPELYEGISNESYFYFVHSYYVKPRDFDVVSGTTTYGDFTFCSSIQKGNVFGVQYHPEKSSNIGIQLLNNFLSK